MERSRTEIEEKMAECMNAGARCLARRCGCAGGHNALVMCKSLAWVLGWDDRHVNNEIREAIEHWTNEFALHGDDWDGEG